MKFGLFYELQLPKPWEPDDERRIVRETLEQIQLADRLGFDYVWEVEHHFLEEYSHSSAPEIVLAAAAALTTNIRLAHGIVLVPPPYNHPARVAERIATLDLVSGGRVDFGTGESSSEMELGGFGVSREEKKAMWEEAVSNIVKMFRDGPFPGHQGRYFSMPRRNVVPKPLQKPHPPLWVACSRRETIQMAARFGIGALSFDFVDAEEARARVDDYYRLIREECEPIGDAVNAQVAVVSAFMCADTDEEAEARGLAGAQFFSHALAHYYGPSGHDPGNVDLMKAFQVNPITWQQQRERHCIGSSDTIRKHLRAFEEAGVDQVIFLSQAGRNRHEDIMASMEKFAREVMPEFKEREPEHQRRRGARLAAGVS